MDQDIEFTGGYSLNHWPETAKESLKEKTDKIQTWLNSKIEEGAHG